MLHSSKLLAALTLAATGIAAPQLLAADTKAAVAPAMTAPKITVLETKVISPDPEHYHGWPTITRLKNGQLAMVYSGGREGHIDPFGRVEMMVSNDDGKTWGAPRVILDTNLDDRDAGILETARGTLLVTTFISTTYEGMLKKAREAAASKSDKAWDPQRLTRWEGAHSRLTTDAQRAKQIGEWMLRSTDGGLSWSAQMPSIVSSPHGPIQLRDGRLLHMGNMQSGEKKRGICESTDDGQTWHWLADLPTRAGDDPKLYWELHAVETNDNRIVLQVRNHNKINEGETLQCESRDGGKTWTTPQSIGVWGLPSHLLKLRNGNLLMTYGYRRVPFGNQARLSKDGGRTWSEPMTISGDGVKGDLGYPSTVELADGSFVSVWYEQMASSPQAVLRQAHWKMQ